MKKLKYAMLLLLTIALGCDNEIDFPESIMPSNLTVSSENADGGTVNFTASASDANYYHFDFGDGTSHL